MQALRSRCKGRLLRVVTSVLLYSRVLKLLNRLVNDFQCKKNVEKRLVFPFIKKRLCGNVQILTYHRVNDDHDPFFPATPVNLFANQMEYLASNFNICSLFDAVQMMKKKDVPDNVIVITFDDGYKDNYLNAFPILK